VAVADAPVHGQPVPAQTLDDLQHESQSDQSAMHHFGAAMEQLHTAVISVGFDPWIRQIEQPSLDDRAADSERIDSQASRIPRFPAMLRGRAVHGRHGIRPPAGRHLALRA
jgi:hypothetical protein